MTSIKMSICALFLLLVCDVITGAPVQELIKDAKDSSINAKVADVGTQETEIQDLLNLVKSQAQARPVAVQHQVETHVENVNGHVIKVQEKEEKVVDTQKGEVVSDVKQKIQEAPSGNDGKPEVAVETKVDIPSVGIHETINQESTDQDAVSMSNSPGVQAATSAILDHDVNAMRQNIDEQSDENNDESFSAEDDDEEEQRDVSPAEMAAFLYASQQLDAFYPALEKLVNESKMTPDEAESYAQEVVFEYQRLQARDMEMSALAAKRDASTMDLYAQQQPLTSGSFGVDSLAPQPMDAYGYNEGYLSPQEQFMAQLQLQQQQQQQQQEENQQYMFNADYGFDPLDFLTVLFEAAYGKGNREAQDILRLLYDRVSQDDNPADLEQIRELLIDIVANSLTEDRSQEPWDLSSLIPSERVVPEFGPVSLEAMVPPAAQFAPESAAKEALMGNFNNNNNINNNINNQAGDSSANENISPNEEEEEEEKEEEDEDLEAQLSNIKNQKMKRDDETTNLASGNDNDQKPKAGETESNDDTDHSTNAKDNEKDEE